MADELRFTVRRLLKNPGATLAAILTLAVAIGAATATWSLLSAVLLRPLPLQEPDRLFVVESLVRQGPRAGTRAANFQYPYLSHIRESRIFERVAAQWLPYHVMPVSAGGFAVNTPIAFVTHDFFDVIGVAIPHGRSFLESEDQRGAGPVAIVTDRYWRRALDADPNAIGRTIKVGSRAMTIVGVTPPRFRGLDLAQAPDLFVPFHALAELGSRSTNYFAEPSHRMSPTSGVMIVGRVRDGGGAAAELERLSRLGPTPAGSQAPQFALTNVQTAAIPQAAREGMSRFAWLLAMTVALLLVIGCGTVGLLLLIRTEARRDEFAMCLALGASRWRLVQGVAIEGALLSAAGAALALPVAIWLFDGVRGFQLPGRVSIELLDLTLDSRLLAAAAACAMLATLAIALIAGVFGFSGRLSERLRSRAGATPQVTRRRTRAVLVAAQVAVAVTLLAGTGLFARSLLAAMGLNAAMDDSRIVIADFNLAAPPYLYTPERATPVFDEFAQRLNGNPSIRSASSSSFEVGMSPLGHILVDGARRQFATMVSLHAVDEHYFETMGIRLVAGRSFTSDDRPPAAAVTLVSESFGRMLADGGNPIGLRLVINPAQPNRVAEVVGIVPDVVTSVAVLQPLVMYTPIAHMPPLSWRTFSFRAAGDPDAVRRELTLAIKETDPSIVPPPFLTLEERIIQQMAPQHFGALVMGSLGFIAILLTLLGTYVVADSMAIVRTREMGIRAALGARGSQLAAIVLTETGILVGIGVVAGVGIVWAGSSTIRTLLFGVEPLDGTTLGVVASLMLVMALAASLRPALRAARVDLASVLREE
jgi:putative ABC transport system permease protein